MAIHLRRHKLTLFTVPKAACTSLKLYFYELEHGKPFKSVEEDASRVSIHSVYPSKSFNDIDYRKIQDHHRIAVVRDPVRRIKSCFENKVLDQGVLRAPATSAYLSNAGVTNTPDFAEFVANLPTFRRASMLIRTHTNLLRFYLGDDPEYLARIYDISELASFEADVADRTGFEGSMRHSARSRSSVEPSEVTSRTREHIARIYSDDYTFFGKWFRES